MNFFIWRKNNFSFSRCLDFCIFGKSTNLKICGVIIDIFGSYTFAYFFWVLSTIKMKFGQILVYLIANISDIFFAHCWRLENSSTPFYDFNEMAIYQDLLVLSSWHLPFLIVLHSPFQKNEIVEYWYIWLLSNWSWLLNCKVLGTLPQFSKSLERFLENVTLVDIYQLAKFDNLMTAGSKIHLKITMSHVLKIHIMMSQIW